MPYSDAITTPAEVIAGQRSTLLLATLPMSAAANATVALIAVVVLLRSSLPTQGLWIWGAWILALQCARLLIWFAWRKLPSTDLDAAQNTRRLQLLRGAAWATGASWGTIPVALFPADTLAQSFVAFFLAGISGAAVAGLAFDAWTSGVFVVTVIVPLALRLFLIGTPMTAAMAAMVLIYLLYLGVAIRWGQSQFLQLLDWRTRAEAASARAQRQARRHAVLAQANQLGACASDAESLYAAVCQAAVDSTVLLRARILQPGRADPAQSPDALSTAEAAWREDRPQFNTRDGITEACVPLHSQGRIEALLCVESTATPGEDATLRDWLQHLGTSLERGLQAIRQSAHIVRLQKLYSALIGVGEVMLQSRSADEMVTRTCEKLAQDTQFHAAWLARPDDSGAFRVLARAGEGALQLDHFRVHLNDANRVPLVLRVWDTQTLQVCNDLLRDPDMQPWNSTLSRYRWHAALATPVWRGGALWGVLVFTSPQAQAFDEQTIALCEQVAALLGYGLDELDVKERLSHLQRVEAHRARHDTLTGLPNRYALEQYLPEVIARARRQGSLFAVGMIDLDGFKLINDTWGHSAGDRVLRELTRRLQAVQRQTDFLVRLGGDEFVVVMEDLNPLEVQTGYANSVQRLRQAVAAPFDIAPNVQLPIDMSIGISAYPLDAQDADTLMRLADKAMYAAKPKNRTSANSP